MDMVHAILQEMNKGSGAMTVRHIAKRTGFAHPTLVGVMMGMINQGYIARGSEEKEDTPGEQRCSCACCSRKPDQETTSSLDIRTYRITLKGQEYLRTWAGKKGT